MEELEFGDKNKIFGPKVNYTVRKGTKWSVKVQINDVVEVMVPLDEDGMMIFDKHGDKHGPVTAVITDVEWCLFKDLPEKVYKHLHNPKYRNKRGLEKGMDRAYGEHSWDEQIVTYVGFIILEIEDD